MGRPPRLHVLNLPGECQRHFRRLLDAEFLDIGRGQNAGAAFQRDLPASFQFASPHIWIRH